MQFPMQTRANEMNTTREIKNSNGFAIFITFSECSTYFDQAVTWPNLLAPLANRQRGNYEQTGRERERSTQGGASGGKGGDVECDSVALHADTP